MSYWSNIEVSSQDPEIIEINNFEKCLGELSEDVQKIRELIRRFEVCHFKYKKHLNYINDSILKLSPNVEPANIGANHISKGKDVLNNDKTGRSRVGQQYLCSLLFWLGDNLQESSEYFNEDLNQQIMKLLSDKNQDKERMVRLLIARLMWDWKSYELYKHGGEFKELELQISRMDICHYVFPKHLDRVIQGIGLMEAIDNFEGCGSFNSETKNYVEEKFLILIDYLKFTPNKNNSMKIEQTRIWLTASLAKTLKEQVGLNIPLPALNKY